MGGKPHADVVALQALGWIAADDGRLAAFLDLTGLAPADLRARAQEPIILGAVLDFLMQDDRTVLAFCADAGLPPDAPMAARTALPGGDLPHWT
ncbi:MAG: DUF3572 domain-containing protein [Gemmobacter sp.]